MTTPLDQQLTDAAQDVLDAIEEARTAFNDALEAYNDACDELESALGDIDTKLDDLRSLRDDFQTWLDEIDEEDEDKAELRERLQALVDIDLGLDVPEVERPDEPYFEDIENAAQEILDADIPSESDR